MMTAGVFFLFLGLLVFGPKKTIEMSQNLGRTLAQFKQAASKFQAQLQEEVRAHEASPSRSHLSSSPDAESDEPTGMTSDGRFSPRDQTIGG
jgi:Sec-independent protein translocase protein TatA